MRFSMKTLGVVAFSAALIIPAIGFLALSKLDKVNASDEHLSDEEVFASHYPGLTKNEINTYVNYLDEIEQLTSQIDHLVTADGEVLNREQYDQLQEERDRVDKEVYFLEKKSWLVETKERIQGFTDITEELRQSLLNDVDTLLVLEEKLKNPALPAAEKERLNEELDNTYRHFTGDISYFDKLDEIEQLDGLTKEEKSQLLASYVKINVLNQKIAHLTYDEYYEIVPQDQETYKQLQAEIDAIYEKEIAPLEKKAGL